MTQTDFERRCIRAAAALNAKAIRLGAPGRVTGPDLVAVFAGRAPNCPYCGIGIEPMSCSFDHMVPFARGGSNEPSNIVACCLTCQREKFDKTPSELAAYRRLVLTCPICGRAYRPRWGEYREGRGRVCSRRCSARKRWRERVPA
jgi:hypothetical protein